MADSPLLSSSITQRARWLAIPAALFTAGGAILLWRRGQTEAVLPSTTLDVTHVVESHAASETKPRKPQSPVRWLLYLGAAMLFAGLLVILEVNSPELSAAIFILLLLASILYGAFHSADKISQLILSLRYIIAYPRAVLRQNATGLSLIAGSAAVIFAVWSALLFWDSRSFADSLNQAAQMFIFCLVALWAAFALRPNDVPMMTIVWGRPVPEPDVTGFMPNMRLFIRRAGTRLALFGGLALLAIVTEINGQFIKSDILALASIHVQFVLLVAGAILLVIGLTGVVTRVSTAQPAMSRLERWRPLWPLALITLLALVLRFWHLDLAMRFLIDERSFIDGTYDIHGYSFVGLLQPFSSISAFPYVYPYWQTLTMALFGSTLFGLRATSAILGTLAIPATYFLARTLFDRKTAILAALMLATFPPHIQFSRIAISEISSPFFATMAFAFLARALKEGQRRDFVLAGVMLGFTHYFHEGGRLLFTPVALAWLFGCLIFMQVKDLSPFVAPWTRVLYHIRRLRQELFLMLAALVIIAVPIYLTLIGIDRPIFARLVDNHSGLTGNYWGTLLTTPDGLREHFQDHILPAFEVLFNRQDSTLFYSQTTPLLLTGMLIVVTLGFAFACYHWRKPGPMLLIIWVMSTSLGNTLMKDSTGSPRFVMVFPALAILAAVALRYVVPMVVRRARWQTLTIAILSILLAAYQFNFYFNQHLPEYNFVFRAMNSAPDGYDAAWRSLNFPKYTRIHIISTPVYNQIESQGLIMIWRNDMTVDTLLSRYVLPRYLESLACGVDHAFYVQKKDEKVILLLNRYFKLDPPQFTQFTDLDPSERFVLYYAPYHADDGTPFSTHCKHVGQSS